MTVQNQQQSSLATETYLVTRKELHLGFVKETFGRGAVIVHDIANKRMIVDGRPFEDARDIELLKRQAVKFPNKPYIVPYSPEKEAELKGLQVAAPTPQPKPRPGENMPVVQSDEDMHTDINIEHTKVAAQKQAERDAANQPRDPNAPMEIIRGDETVEDRIARLERERADRRAMGKGTDLAAEKQLVELKAKHAQGTEVVHDDSYGMSIGKNEIPLNAGQHLPSREEAEAKTADAAGMAEVRKTQAQQARDRLGLSDVEMEVVPMPGQATGSHEAPSEPSSSPPVQDARDTRIAELEAQVAAKKEMDAKDIRIAELEAQLAAGGGQEIGPDAEVSVTEDEADPILGEVSDELVESAKAAAEAVEGPDDVVRTPVTDKEAAEKVLSDAAKEE